MTDKESNNWDKGCIVGFYVFLILLFIDHIYSYISNNGVFSNGVIFWVGLISVFAVGFILDMKDLNLLFLRIHP